MNINTIIKILAIIAGICSFLLLILVNSKNILIGIVRIKFAICHFWKHYGYKGLRWEIASTANSAMKLAEVRFLRRMKIVSMMFFSFPDSLNYLKATMYFFKEVHMDPPEELCETFQAIIDLGGLK